MLGTIFNLNLVSFFTGMGFIKKSREDYLKNKDTLEIFFTEIRFAWPKIAKRTTQIVRFKYVFELYELALVEFSNVSFIGKSGETNESAQSKWFCKLKEFELHWYYCTLKQV